MAALRELKADEAAARVSALEQPVGVRATAQKIVRRVEHRSKQRGEVGLLRLVRRRLPGGVVEGDEVQQHVLVPLGDLDGPRRLVARRSGEVQSLIGSACAAV